MIKDDHIYVLEDNCVIDGRIFKRLILVTLLGAAALGFALGFVTGFLLK